MIFENKKLIQVKNALQYGMLFSNDEVETAEFALLLSDVEHELAKHSGMPRSQVATGLPASTSLDKCPFHYCDSDPKCQHTCRYNNEQNS